MADYQLTATDAAIIRAIDQAHIPNDPANRDWMKYQEWLAAGGVPDPYVKPPKVTILSTDFIAKFTNAEYLAVGRQRAADLSNSKVGYSKNWDIVVFDDTINLSNQKTQTLKADLVRAGVLTQARADEIFS